jgi:antitoxin (DNA-binding transcriptional repressor) of toxin-antitoxin stability system
MTTVSCDTDNPSLEKLIEMASEGAVIITQNNKPVFAFVPIDQDDIATWKLGENAAFLELMQHSWQRMHSEGGISLAEARRQLLNK